MNNGKIILVAAVAKNNIIGKTNSLPWYLPEDLKHFKEITQGHIVLMGRKTFESILNRLGNPLPNRKNIIVTKRVDYHVRAGVELYHSIDEVFAKYVKEDIYVIGGASIYKQTIDKAHKLYITQVHEEYEGDVYFPEIDMTKWVESVHENHDKFSFVTYIRKINES